MIRPAGEVLQTGPMPSPPTTRQAHPQDRETVVATVTAAFAQDPGWAFILGEEYGRLAADFVGALFDTRVGARTVAQRRDRYEIRDWGYAVQLEDVVTGE